VTRKEYLGSRQLLEVETGGEHFTLEVAEDQFIEVGAVLRFSFDPRKACLFLRL
jgi:ABC-type sugar transport system ATPase subunit